MSYDYATFVATVQTMLVIDPSDADLATMMPRIIEAAELRCYRDVDFLVTRTVAQTVLENGILVGEDAALMPAPDDLVVARKLDLFTPAGGTRRVGLERRTASFLNDYWPDRSVTGTPKYWAEPTYGQILIVPTPDAAYSVELSYTLRPAPLSATNTTTWLATWAPDLLLYAALTFGSAYTKSPESKAGWEADYQKALQTTVIEEQRRKAAGYTDYSQSQPPKSGGM